MYKVIYVFLIFFIYSIIGYLCEVMGIFFETGKLNFSRGYFIGPYLPIFGFGSLIITYYLNRYQNDLVALFIMGSFFCCLLEYLTSLIMEKIFKLRWWDYSHKKFNLKGRICLETGVLFGIGSLIIVKITNPIIFKILSSFNHHLLIIIGIILFIIMFDDFLVSTFTICKLKVDTSKFTDKDSTKQIREEVKKSLRKYRFFHNRLFKAFPDIPEYNYNISKIREYINSKSKNNKK